MPLYDYRCQDCGDFEAWRSLSEIDIPLTCPSCEAIAQRIFSPPMVNLSGSFPGTQSQEPKLIKRERSPEKPRNQSVSSGRPWMISHAPPRF